jgi:hypothetical protein
MTPRQHKARHVKLHADYVLHHEPDPEKGYMGRSIEDLLQWSHVQTIHPDVPKTIEETLQNFYPAKEQKG